MITELPVWVPTCVVQAAKICRILHTTDGVALTCQHVSQTFHVKESPTWASEHDPEVGGFYVVEGGRSSYWPEVKFLEQYRCDEK